MNKNSSNATSAIMNIVMLVAIYFLFSWFWGRNSQNDQKPAPPPVQAHVAPLPPVLQQHLATPFAQQSFQNALAEVEAGKASGPDDRQKNFTKAVDEDLEPIVKKENQSSQDGLTATLEIAYIDTTLRDQASAAASMLANTTSVLDNLTVKPQVAVFSQGEWIVQPADTAASNMYKDVVAAINKENQDKVAYQFINFFVKVFSWAGSYKDALALIVLGILVTVLLTPVRNWQYKSMAKMAKLQPEMKKIQDQYKGQPEEIQRRTMELYKEHGTNPFMGCLPLLVQAPFMWWLYYAVRTYQFQFSGHFLWIGSAFAQHMAGTALRTPKGPFFAIDLGHMDIPLLILYTVSMYFYSKLMPMTTADPEQIKQSQRTSVIMSLMMPVMFYMYAWPSAFILWWLSMNVANILMTQFYLRHHPDLQAMYQNRAAAAAAAADAGGSRPTIKMEATDKARTASTGSKVDTPAEAPPTVGQNPGGNGAATRRIEPKNRRKQRRRF